ncbi:MAG: hypothetical protein ACOCTR_02600 [Candidatus Natronoplasma sp.]
MTKGDVTIERLELKPEWVQRIGPEREDILGPYLVFIVLGVILLTLLLFSGGAQIKFLAMLLIVLVGFSVIFAAKRNTKSISLWRRGARGKERENLPLKRRSELLERGVRGLKLSQALLERRLRKSLMEKVKDEEDLSDREMKGLLKDHLRLRKMVEDDTLVDFLLNSKRLKDVIDEENDSSKFLEVLRTFRPSRYEERSKDESYEDHIEEVMEKITDWRR